MKHKLLAILTLTGLVASGVSTVSCAEEAPTTRPAATQPATSALQFTATDIDGKEVDLASYKGKVVMIVNVASKCGYTKQYTQLQAVYEKYKGDGFVILGFPCNQFKNQEPGTEEDIKTFCTAKYNVQFPLMSKVDVNGDAAHPLFKFITGESTAGQFAGPIAWNFTKFVIDREGKLVGRYASKVTPDAPEVIELIEGSLKK